MKKDSQFLENIISMLPGHIYWKDKNGVLLGCNDEQAKFIGLKSRHDIVGLTAYDTLPKHEADEVTENDKKVIETGDTITTEEIVVLPNGKKSVWLSKKVPLKDKENNVTGILGISIDITARKRAELREKQAISQALAAEKAKSKAEEDLRQAVMVLNGSIVHDLRTPIKTVEIVGANILKFLLPILDGYQQAVESNVIKDPIRRSTRSILMKSGDTLKITAQHMNSYIDETLKTLSKTLVNDLNKDDLSLCSAEKCIRNTLESYPYEEKESGKIISNVNDFEFLGNQILMIRVISNLVKNAFYQIHKNKKGKIYITTDISRGMNTIKIKDTAGGAPKEVVETFFEGYKTNKEGGTGIGLAFVKKTMNSFGGDVECQGKHGDYIEFILKFPKIHGLN